MRTDELLYGSRVVEVQDGELEAFHLRHAVKLLSLLGHLLDLLNHLLQRHMRAYFIGEHLLIVIIGHEPQDEVIIVIVIIHLDLVILPIIFRIERWHLFYITVLALEL